MSPILKKIKVTLVLLLKISGRYFFRNRNIRRKKSINAKKLPQEIFREAGLKLDIDLIRIKKGGIKYTEISPG